MRTRIRLWLRTALCSVLLLAPLAAADDDLPAIAANDNRTPAGQLRDGVLRLELELRKGIWYPESEKGEAIPSYALAEVGKPLQVPSPAIRVPQGSTIDVSVRNTLAVPATLYGLHSHPEEHGDGLTIDPGDTKQLRFDAGAPGVYVYWGRTPDGKRGNGRVLDALLGGAFVVDAPGDDPAADRIFVLERWNGPTRTAINGKSWPFTERLDAEVGRPERWKIVNASDLSHPMHLHGFDFRLDGYGKGGAYERFDEADRRLEFTQSVDVMETFEITWTPQEPGRWLYHCHRMPHMRLPVPLDPGDAAIPDPNPDHAHMHAWDSGFAGMGGMILGITVTGPSAIDTVNGWKPGRRLEVDVANRAGNPDLYSIAIQDLDSAEPPAESAGLAGPLLIVREGEKTEITVKNHAAKPTIIHWHGLEIESYYDGVPWWSGIGEKRAPLIEPGHEFLVKLIPQEAGSYIYHTHWHDEGQLTGGVHGPMIVLPPDGEYDAETDHSFLLSLSPSEPFGGGQILLNGAPQHGPLRLKAGTRYRFRFMNITPAVDNLQVSLGTPTEPVQWRMLAKDATDVENAAPRRAVQHIAIGETFDFEYRSPRPQELRLEVWSPTNYRRVTQTLLFE